MSDVRIYKPSKSAMQSGRANSKTWVLEHAPTKKSHDRLMGWVGSEGTTGQIKLRFSSKEEAIEYAQEHGLAYTVQEPKIRTIIPKNYSANFAPRRVV